jgi:hypothetical protein
MKCQCVKIESIERVAPIRKPGYVAACRAAARKDSPQGLLCFDWPTFFSLKKDYHLPPPTIPQLLLQFGRSLAQWRKAGYPVTSFSVYRFRLATCRACPQWQEDAYLGLGKCQACKCSGIKHWLATEACPQKKW